MLKWPAISWDLKQQVRGGRVSEIYDKECTVLTYLCIVMAYHQDRGGRWHKTLKLVAVYELGYTCILCDQTSHNEFLVSN